MEKLKVLVADDNKSALAFYQMGLKEEEFDRKFVNNGKEAVDAYMEWTPDVVVLDIMMPVMSGYQALKAIREMEKKSGRNTVIVVSTALADKSDIVDCVKVGIQGYMLKPFRYEELAGKIRGYHRTHVERKMATAAV
jgi:CheY-like chemotaxis protein